MAATGWWFILWLWAPIYGSVLAEEFFQPLWAAFNDPSGAAWFGTHTGTFVVTLITIVLAGIVLSLGMAGYARVQKLRFLGGLLGVAIIVIVLLVNSRSDFIAAFNHQSAKLFGMNKAYAATTAAAYQGRGSTPPTFGFTGDLGAVDAARADADVLPAVAQLGHHAVRRDPRGRATSSGCSPGCSPACG